jgi:hypothetical protein
MKKYIIIAFAAATMAACNTQPQATPTSVEEVSWAAFCAARGHNLNDNSSETINEYLDTWCGSVAEEQAFIKAGIELN